MFRPLKAILKERIKQYSFTLHHFKNGKKDLFGGIIRRNVKNGKGFTDDLLVDEIFKLWEQFAKEELGPELQGKIRAFCFKKGVLTVEVSQSDLLQRLKPKETIIIKRINKLLERNFINPQELKKITYKT